MRTTYEIHLRLVYVTATGPSIGGHWEFEGLKACEDFMSKARLFGLTPLGKPTINTQKFSEDWEHTVICQTVWMQGEDFFKDIKRIDKATGY